MSWESEELVVARRSKSPRVAQAIAEDYFLVWARETWTELSEFRPDTNVHLGHLVEEIAKLAIFLSFNHRETIPSAVVDELFSYVRKLPQVALEYAAATAYGYESWEDTGLIAPDMRETPTELSGRALIISIAKDAKEAASGGQELHEQASSYTAPWPMEIVRLTPTEVGDLIWDLVQVELVILNGFNSREKLQVIGHQLLNNMLDVIGPFFDSQLKAAGFREPVHLVN